MESPELAPEKNGLISGAWRSDDEVSRLSAGPTMPLRDMEQGGCGGSLETHGSPSTASSTGSTNKLLVFEQSVPSRSGSKGASSRKPPQRSQSHSPRAIISKLLEFEHRVPSSPSRRQVSPHYTREDGRRVYDYQEKEEEKKIEVDREHKQGHEEAHGKSNPAISDRRCLSQETHKQAAMNAPRYNSNSDPSLRARGQNDSEKSYEGRKKQLCDSIVDSGQEKGISAPHTSVADLNRESVPVELHEPEGEPSPGLEFETSPNEEVSEQGDSADALTSNVVRSFLPSSTASKSRSPRNETAATSAELEDEKYTGYDSKSESSVPEFRTKDEKSGLGVAKRDSIVSGANITSVDVGSAKPIDDKATTRTVVREPPGNVCLYSVLGSSPTAVVFNAQVRLWTMFGPHKAEMSPSGARNGEQGHVPTPSATEEGGGARQTLGKSMEPCYSPRHAFPCVDFPILNPLWTRGGLHSYTQFPFSGLLRLAKVESKPHEHVNVSARHTGRRPMDNCETHCLLLTQLCVAKDVEIELLKRRVAHLQEKCDKLYSIL